MGDNTNPLLLTNGTHWVSQTIKYTLYADPSVPYIAGSPPISVSATATYLYTHGITTDAPLDVVTPEQWAVTDYFLLDAKTLLSKYAVPAGDVEFRDSFSDVSPLVFKNYANGGQIFVVDGNIANSNSEAITGVERPEDDNPIITGAITVLDDAEFQTVNQDQLALGQNGALNILHELAHALGLIHSNSVAADQNAGYTDEYATQKFSIMTSTPTETVTSGYNPQDPDMENSSGVSSVFPSGLQLYDIAAIQSLYGRNYLTRADNTVYTEGTINGNVQAFGSDHAKPVIYTIWDGNGIDLIDASPYTTAAQIDLRQGHFSSIGYKDSSSDPVAFDTPPTGDSPEYDAGNIAIAYHTVIENAYGTNAGDSIIGNDWSNVLYGAGGADKIYGDGQAYDADRGFNEVTHDDQTDRAGTNDPNGSDPLHNPFGPLPHDVLIGGAGDDTLFAGIGDDVLDGGYDKTAIDIATADTWVVNGQPVSWDSAGQFTGTNNASQQALPENLDQATDGNDTADYSGLFLGQSSDFILGQTIAGIPVSIGLNPRDPDYVDATWNGISVFMTSDGGTVYKGNYGQDQLLSIENVVGTGGNDFFTGTNGSTDLEKPLTYNGGAGNDVYSFSDLDSGVVKIIDPSGTDMLDIDLTESADGLTGSTSWKFVTVDGVEYLDIMAQHGTGTPLQVLLDENNINSAVDYVQFSGENLVPVTLTPEDIEQVLTYLQAHPTAWGPLYNAATGVFTGSMPLLPTHHSIQFLDGPSTSGGVSPTFDGGGNITSLQAAGEIGVASNNYATENLHPFVVTTYSASGSGSAVTTNIGYSTAAENINLLGGITPGDVRLTVDGTRGDASLTVHIDNFAASFTINHFETGQTIDGLGYYTAALHSEIQGSSSASLTATGTDQFLGTYVNSGMTPISGSVEADYFLDSLTFVDGGSVLDLQSGQLTFTGTDGNDVLYGLDSRADLIIGGAGDDTIQGFGGNDTLEGGTGNDTYVFSNGDGQDVIHETSGIDTIQFDSSVSSGSVTYSQSGDDLVIHYGTGTDEITVSGFFTSAGNQIEQVVFSDDTVQSTSYILQQITGSAGTTGDDTLTGTSGDDTLIGGTGNDTLSGGDGNDTYVFANGDGHDVVTDTAGSDTIQFDGSVDVSTVHYAQSGTDLVITYGTGTDQITVTGFFDGTTTYQVEQIVFADGTVHTADDITQLAHSQFGTSGDDTLTGLDQSGFTTDYLYGLDGNDTLDGGVGADTMVGGKGDDTYFVDNAGDTIIENWGEGTDTVSSSVSYALPDNVENLTLTGSSDLAATGNWMDNVITGNSGNDTFDGGTGNDTFNGGTGDDTYLFSAGDGVDIINETGGNDQIHFDASVTPTDVAYIQDGNDLDIEYLDGSDQITVAGFFASGSAVVEDVVFADGTTQDSTFVTDHIYSGTGTSGDDLILGTFEDDTINGGTGDDTMYGHGGNDTYMFASGDGSDTIIESSGNDTIQFDSSVSPSDVSFTQSGYDLVLHYGSDEITVKNYFDNSVDHRIEQVVFSDGTVLTDLDTLAHTQLGTSSDDTITANDYLGTDDGGATSYYLPAFVSAGDGNDTIYGADGVDNLDGGAGDNTIVAGTGLDFITADDGNNLVTTGDGGGYVALGDGDNVVTIGTGNEFVSLGEGNNTVTGGDGDDFISAGGGANILSGGDGNNVISAGDGINTITAGSGDDLLSAGDGGNTFDGGAGTNVITSGIGDDTYLINDVTATNLISDAGGTDTIKFGSAFSAANFTEAQTDSGSGLTDLSIFYNGHLVAQIADQYDGSPIENIKLNDGSTLVAAFVTTGTASDDSITGSTLSDTLDGAGGNDTITGNGGNDTFILDGGNDVVSAGSGNDTYILSDAAGHSVITDAGGTDTIKFDGSVFKPSVSFVQDGNDLDIYYGTHGEYVTVTGYYDTLGSGQVENFVYTNHAPVATNDSFDASHSNSASGNVLTNDVDLDGDTITVTPETLTTAHGGDVVVNSDGSFTYTADHTFTGSSDSFTYTVSDTNSATATATVTISNITGDHAPVAASDSFSASNTGSASGNVLTNDSDPDGDSFSAVAGTLTSAHGATVVMNSDGSFTYDTTTYRGTDTFTYTDEDALGATSTGTATITDVFTNHAPVANNDSYNAANTGSVSGYVLTNDTDADGDTITVSGTTLTTTHGATVVLNSDGSFTYTADHGYSGSDSFSYSESDTYGGTSSATVTITNVFGDHAPTAENDTISAGSTGSASGNVFSDNGNGADSDSDGDTFSVTAATLTTSHGGDVVLNSDGSFTYSVSGYRGSDTFTYTDTDSLGATSTGTVTISNIFTNASPVANNDSYNAGSTGSVSGNVLSNDTDADGDTITATAQTLTTSHGATVVIDSDGSFSYTAAHGYSGSDSFTYSEHDPYSGTASGTATISNVFGDQLPVAKDDTFSGSENTALSGNVLSNNGNGADSDADGDTLSVTAGTLTTAHGADVVLNSDGSFTYTPASGYAGSDTFNYTLNDGVGGTATGHVNITVGTHPPVANDDSFSAAWKSAITGNVLSNDTDADSDTLHVVQSSVTTANGNTVTLNSDGSFSYTPPVDYIGSDTFTYTASDGHGGTDDATVTLTVNTPSGATLGTSGADSITGTGSNDLIFGLAGNDTISGGAGADTIYGGAGNDSIDGGTSADTMVGGLGDDTYVVDSTSDVIIENANEGTDTVLAGTTYSLPANVENLTLTGSVTTGTGNSGNNIITGNSSGNSLIGGAGDDTLIGNGGGDHLQGGTGNDTYSFSSGNGNSFVTENGGEGTDTIALHGVSASSVTMSDNTSGELTIKYGTSDQVTIENGSYNSTTGFVVGNVESIVFDDGTTWSLTGGLTFTTHGSVGYGTSSNDTLTLASDASFSSLVGFGGDDTLIAGAVADHLIGGTGNDTYSFKSGDGNDFVTENGGEGTDTIALHGVSASSVTMSDNTSGELIVKYTSGDQVTIENGSYNSTTGFAVGNVENIAFDDGTTWSLTGGLTFSTAASTAYGTSSADTITQTADFSVVLGYAGNDTLVAAGSFDSLTGGAGADTFKFTNAAASNNITDFSIADGDKIDLSSLLTGFDPVHNNLSDWITETVSGSNTLIKVDIDGTGGAHSMTQVVDILGVTGLASINTLVQNGTIIVFNVQSPTAVNDSYNASGSGTVSGNVLTNDTDPNGGTLSATAGTFTSTHGGTVIVSSNGSFTYDALHGYSGSDSFNYSETDSFGKTASASATISNVFGDQPPVAENDSFSVNENTVLTGNVLSDNGNGADSDPDGDALVVADDTLTTAHGGDVVLHNDGSFSYTPALNYTGSDSFSYTLIDSLGDTVTGHASVTVSLTNHIPVATDDSFSANWKTPITGNVLSNDTDADSDTLHVVQSTVTTANGNTVTLNSDGSFSYTPPVDYIGSDTFTYTVSDGHLGTDDGTVTLTVNTPSGATLGTSGADTITGTGSANLIFGLAGNDTISGGSGNDTIYGGTGNDSIDGGSGVDTMAGGAGDDTYTVDNSSDVVIENSAQGTDTVVSSVDYTLTANVENLTLTGGAKVGTGNDLDNIITGTGNRETLSGGGGDDIIDAGTGGATHGHTLIGGLGDDTFIVYNPNHDTIIENPGEGTDTVQTGANYTLDANIENLELTGTNSSRGTGNALDNLIVGNTGNNSLSGGDGNDTLDGGDGLDHLTGGAGSDTFVFHAATAFNNIDVVTDFHTADNDKIDIADLLTGYHAGTDNIDDFVSLVTSGANTLLKVDLDGTGSSHSMTQIATLVGVTGLSVDTLVANGELIISH